MQSFITGHELVSALLINTIIALLGTWLAHVASKRLLSALIPKVRMWLAGTAAELWFLMCAVFFSIFIFVLATALLPDFGLSQQDLAFVLFFEPLWALIPFVIILAGAVWFGIRAKYSTRAQHSWLGALWHGLWPAFAILSGLFVALLFARLPAINDRDATAAAIAKIDGAHITMADVMGTNLPPQPYEPENDATIAGLDKNNNGIRDDVELAIFKKYPNSAKIRAAELQYALALQLMIMDVFNSDTWKVAAVQEDRGYQCIGEAYPRTNMVTYNEITDSWSKEVETLVFSTQIRKTAKDDAFNFTTSFSLPNQNFCDIDINSLPN